MKNVNPLQCSQKITIEGHDGTTQITFDLKKVKMSQEQEAIVTKLFKQNPVTELVEDEHDFNEERSKTGPGSKYLSPEDFEKVRRLGVRLLGPAVAGPIVDFCLHVVNVGRLAQDSEVL